MEEFENQPISTGSHCFLIYLSRIGAATAMDFAYSATHYQREKARQLFLGRRH
jgi:hypothetical protein